MTKNTQGYWSADLPLIWDELEPGFFSEAPFIVVDGGAAGELFQPFDAVAEHCLIYTFEPRGEDNIVYEKWKNIDAGLWSERCKKELHLAVRPGTSSIYPPDLDYLRRFPDRVGVPARTTARKVEVALTSIDTETAAGAMELPNFIKLDIHSAEMEALLGSKGSLNDCLGLLVETWHTPIHKGQHLNGEIETFLAEQGFRLYDMHRASAWHHAVDGNVVANDRKQLVGSESLFLREDVPPHLRPRYLCLLELFGYSNLAVLSCDAFAQGASTGIQDGETIIRIRDKLIANQKARQIRKTEEKGKPVSPQKALDEATSRQSRSGAPKSADKPLLSRTWRKIKG